MFCKNNKKYGNQRQCQSLYPLVRARVIIIKKDEEMDDELDPLSDIEMFVKDSE